MTVTVRSLGSGSSGNALLVESDHAAILVDCGLSPRQLDAGLRDCGRTPSELAAVLLTHEHSDHIRGLAWIAKTGVRIIGTAGTVTAAGTPAANREEIRANRPLAIAGLCVTALGVSHDAAEPVGFHISGVGGTVTVVTDLGHGDEALHDPLSVSDLIVLEANHDEAMLRRGPYPPHLKRRVLSRVGHLSNADCSQMLAEALAHGSGSRTIWLAHLSQTNNRPELATRTVAARLVAGGLTHRVEPLPRTRVGPIWRSDEAPQIAIQLPLL